MRLALDATGSPIEAQAGLPDQAICPQCGGVVILRQRRRGHQSDDVIYFWRHQDRANAHCPARFSVGVKIDKGDGR